MSRLRRAITWLSLDDKPTAVAMGLLIVYYCATWGPWQGKASGDGWFGFLYLKAIYSFHTLDMRTVAPEYFKFFGESGPWHHMPNRCPFGPVILWLPFYLLVAIPESIYLAFHPHHSWSTGQAPLHVWVTGLSTLCAVLVGWRATLQLFKRHLPLDAARLGAMAMIFATPLLWYTAHQPFYQHGIAFGTIALYFERWERGYGDLDKKRFLICGALLGYASAVRAQEIVYVLPLAIELIVRMLRGPERGRALICALVAAGAFLVAFSPQALVWFYYSGKVAPVQAEPIRWNEPWPLVVLFSTRAGLFAWTPIAYLGTAGIVIGLLKKDALGRFMRYFGASFALGFYVVACAWVVPGAYAFGARRLSDAMALVGIGVAIMFARATLRGRRVIIGITIACVVLNLGLMELLRERKIASPGSQTRSLAAELERMHAPDAVVAGAAKIGWPFSQPDELAWTLAHRTNAAVYETVFGEILLERDGQWLTLLTRSVDLTRVGRYHVAEGLRWAPNGGPGIVVGHVRVPLHMFATEAASLQVVGRIGEGTITAVFNGATIAVARQGSAIGIPRLEVLAGYNELELDLPLGSALERIDFNPLKPIQRPKFPRRAPHHRRRDPLPHRDAGKATW